MPWPAQHCQNSRFAGVVAALIFSSPLSSTHSLAFIPALYQEGLEVWLNGAWTATKRRALALHYALLERIAEAHDTYLDSLPGDVHS